MKKQLLAATILFSLLIVAIVVSANIGLLPRLLGPVYLFPSLDKVGHFLLFGILSFLLNKSVLTLLPKQAPARLILAMSLSLAILVALEEWSQSLFPSRTMSLSDLLASFAGVAVFALLAYKIP